MLALPEVTPPEKCCYLKRELEMEEKTTFSNLCKWTFFELKKKIMIAYKAHFANKKQKIKLSIVMTQIITMVMKFASFHGAMNIVYLLLL